MSWLAIIIALVLAFIAFKVLFGLIRIAVIVLLIAVAATFVLGGVPAWT